MTAKITHSSARVHRTSVDLIISSPGGQLLLAGTPRFTLIGSAPGDDRCDLRGARGWGCLLNDRVTLGIT